MNEQAGFACLPNSSSLEPRRPPLSSPRSGPIKTFASLSNNLWLDDQSIRQILDPSRSVGAAVDLPEFSSSGPGANAGATIVSCGPGLW